MRLIDADELLKDVYLTDSDGTTYGRRTYVTFEEIENAPTVEPERKKGKWLWDCDGKVIECSECGLHYDHWVAGFNYCPNCGTKTGEE